MSRKITRRRLHDDAFVFSLEPVDGVLFGDSLLEADSSWLDLTSSHPVSRSDKYYEEIHTEDTC